MNTLQEITKRMLHIENVNMQYNKETNFGQKPNGQEKEIEKLLSEWNSLKVKRNAAKDSLIGEMNSLRKTQKSLKEFASVNDFFTYTKDMAKRKAEILSKLENLYQS